MAKTQANSATPTALETFPAYEEEIQPRAIERHLHAVGYVAKLDDPRSVHCSICLRADQLGWWGMNGTHCRDCHRSWESTALAHCVVCCETFASNDTADYHWTVDGHVHPSEVESLHLVHENQGAVWRRVP
jgi:hypothetical protein